MTVALASPGAQNLLPYYALENGYFEKAGLSNVEVTLVAGSSMLQAIVSNSVQFGIVASAVPELGAKYGHVKWLGSWSLHPDNQIVVGPDVKEFSDMKDKAYGASSPGSFSALMTAVALADAGLTSSDATMISLGAQSQSVAAFTSGQIDALLVGPPTTQQLIDARPGSRIGFDALTVDWVNAGIAADTEWAAKNPEVAKRFMQALDQALAGWLSDPPGAKAILKTYGGASTPAEQDAAYESTVKSFSESLVPVSQEAEEFVLKTLSENGYEVSQSWGDYVENGYLP